MNIDSFSQPPIQRTPSGNDQRHLPPILSNEKTPNLMNNYEESNLKYTGSMTSNFNNGSENFISSSGLNQLSGRMNNMSVQDNEVRNPSQSTPYMVQRNGYSNDNGHNFRPPPNFPESTNSQQNFRPGPVPPSYGTNSSVYNTSLPPHIMNNGPPLPNFNRSHNPLVAPMMNASSATAPTMPLPPTAASAYPPNMPISNNINNNTQQSSTAPQMPYNRNQSFRSPSVPPMTGKNIEFNANEHFMSQIPPQMQNNPYNQMPHLGMPPQQPVKRLDPDQMPNPIQVMEEDQQVHRNRRFITNQVGLVPPLVTTKFIVGDEGNASPRFIRSTMYSIPCNVDMMKQADVPFSLVITPLASVVVEEPLPPVVNTGDFGPVRCVRCKAYMNPYMKFVDGGRRFICILCSAVTEVPPEYFQHLDHTGSRVDRFEKPELTFGAYEFTVTKEYCKDNEIPNVPAFIFVIDVSYNNMKSGMVKLICDHIINLIQNYMPTDPFASNSSRKNRMRVGFITYDTTVHFYNVKACLGQPQMMIVGDMDDMFVPLVDGFLCDPLESLDVINILMQQIPSTFAETKETDTLLLPAIQAGLEALKAAKRAGKLLVFHSSLPAGNFPGKLINREDRKLLGTDKEKILLTPQDSLYTQVAQECVNHGCSIDMFVFNNSHVDLATIGQLSKITGGEIFKYTYFQADIDGERLIEDLKRNLSRQIAFDAVMRVRTSTGVRPVSFFGHLHMTTTTDIELASINADKSIAVEIKHDDKLKEEDGVFIQVALLYTSCVGERRVRILNLALKCCSQMAELFRHCELDTLINYWSKAAVSKLLDGTPRQVKESLVSRGVRILACYRKQCSSPSSPGQLILPECMKLLPLYLNCILKSDAISGGSDMTVDDRCFMMQAVSIMDISSSVNYFYPRLIPLVNINYHSDGIPCSVRCTSYKLSNSEAYLLENGIYMFLWLGTSVPNEWIFNVFGVNDMPSVNVNIFRLPVFDNIHSKKVNSLILMLQKERRRTMKLTIVRETDKMEIVFRRFLVEDGVGGAYTGDSLSSSSYVDFLCEMHKEIRNSLS